MTALRPFDELRVAPSYVEGRQAQGRPEPRRRTARGWLPAAVLCAAGAVACGANAPVALPDDIAPETLAFAGEFHIPSLGRFPALIGLPFGGLSGLSPLGDGQWLAICDEREGSRMYRLRITGEGPSLHVTPADVIGLETGGAAPATIDGEAIAVTPRGTVIVASEGAGNQQPRVPPALVEYDIDGRFLRQLELRDRLLPDPTGALTRGARDNAAFESLTITPGGGRLFTATETALVQDGEPAAIGRGTRSRASSSTCVRTRRTSRRASSCTRWSRSSSRRFPRR